MTQPRISVLMSAFNSERYIGEAVESILGQSFRDFEFLAIDDGSSDRTASILDRYAKDDSRLRVIRLDHVGIAAALNTAIAEARGDYFAKMDSDDVAHPERFARQVAALEADPSLGAIGSFVECIDTEGRPLRMFTPPQDHEEIDRRHLSTGAPCIWHPAAMMRAKAMREIGGYDTSYPYGLDFDLWLRLAEVSRLANLPEALLGYRVHLTSVSVTKRTTQIELAYRALQAARARRGLPDEPLPRMGDRAESEAEILRKWGWWAVKAGHIATARHYARRSLSQAPFSRKSLGLARAAFLGQPRRIRASVPQKPAVPRSDGPGKGKGS